MLKKVVVWTLIGMGLMVVVVYAAAAMLAWA
ncbi:Uncharacterised protein [Slackia heliotrinireducens]|nr:Uncharacterised protein [Slackia heliotrinireducens]